MGAFAEAVMAYAQPLMDATDGSLEELNRALAVSQACWNLAILPEEKREQSLGEMRPILEMDAEEFQAFRESVLLPMIRRHKEMFPRLHQRPRFERSQSDPSSPALHGSGVAAEPYPGTDAYAPCPCNSGRKYKFCCRAKRR
jgi:hypothetical protein